VRNAPQSAARFCSSVSAHRRVRIGIDTGGTFTDIAVYDAVERRVRYGKSLTRYENLVDGVLDALSETGLGLDAFQKQMAQELEGFIALAKSASIKAQ